MVGSELPSEKASETRKNPSAAVMVISRKTPVIRELTVPTAMIALGFMSERSDIVTALGGPMNPAGNSNNHKHNDGNESGGNHPSRGLGIGG